MLSQPSVPLPTTPASTPPDPTRTVARDWRRVYARRLAVTDAIVLIWIVFGTQLFWFDFDQETTSVGFDMTRVVVNYTVISITLIVAWLVTLRIFGTREYRVVGSGNAEYRLIADASIRLFGIIAIIAFLVKLDLARGYFLLAFPLGILVLLLSRWMWRQWLSVQRAHGRYASLVLLVGSADSAEHIAKELTRNTDAGYRVVGACVPTGKVGGTLGDTGIPVSGTVDTVLEAISVTGADTIIITSSDELTPVRVRELSWSLEPGRQHLIVAPSLTDVGGPRIHTRPVAGLPLIHVETPRYEGRKRFSKRAFDILGSGLILLVASPILLVVALLVKFTSPGPVLYRQERIGLNGEPFNMLKFRSMRVNADAELATLLAQQGTSDRPLFKVQNDPRLTRVGATLRKFSLDEFPQLINVFRGDMSLVGPRPQREGEVALYDSAAKRRLIVQPGMTGLWQVSGRSALSWEDAIRLDLYYVENWSLTGDVIILWRTIRAVVAPGKEAH
ncbi:Undecaprenyl-phosphate galactose phosphotransferase, WbaP/exopolysaccharide biosynthesis polyprenyl glycosylphosphotransferase [Plantibacter sp. VKM Ac-1784]|uniref:Undecaprenyl-phosphate galactose phosphotransferase, WbaP/exopolysaccharide biosynthesis polyprenyl glycosylphosphotransferase n=1 Tax=Plantibacter elymi (nom. nud.) TaxID=199708 RepID=A0ABY1RHW0_9MICO|nr:sugar transferase [Plantibacter sp. VKM Ac-1784]SMQ73857.1 Undecaprenyl-phosphate galactose phosphotransferase, WbaP/exopolysaccharide biosynthesis polyprenyl glycosylphosphotransferase [Plantibacter sp. VKM Ac-1784]